MTNKINNLSVVIPSYARHEELVYAVDSVYSQKTDIDIEVIVVDDNPKESKISKINKDYFKKKYPKLKYIKNNRTRGIPGARNCGIDNCNFEFVAFLDDDDWWLPGKIQKQVDAFRSANFRPALIDTGFLLKKSEVDTNIDIALPTLYVNTYRELLSKHTGRAPKMSTVICSLSDIKKIGCFDPTMIAREDLDFYLRISQLGKFLSVLEPLAVKRKSKVGRSPNLLDRTTKGFQIYFNKYYFDITKDPFINLRFNIKYSIMLFRNRNFVLFLLNIINIGLIFISNPVSTITGKKIK